MPKRAERGQTAVRAVPARRIDPPSVGFDAEVAGEDFAAGHEADLDAEVFAGRGEPGQGEEEGEVEAPPGLQAGGIGEHPALARLPGALVALRVEKDHLEKGTRFRGSLPRFKSLVADFEVKENLPGLCRARHDDRLRRMEHQRQRDVASRLFLRQVASQHVGTPPPERKIPQTPKTAFAKFLSARTLSANRRDTDSNRRDTDSDGGRADRRASVASDNGRAIHQKTRKKPEKR